jgi:uncharacterized damage-inducible protein DinB
MYRRIEDFLADWAYETEITTKLFRSLTDASLAQQVVPGGRSLGFIAWHIVITLGEMTEKVGLKVDAPAEDAPQPPTAEAIADEFEKAAKSVSITVGNNWNDETLLKEDDMYGMVWKRGTSLSALHWHQAHHRGQMTVLMRQAGLPVIGIYGPAKEEWADMGIPAPE